MGGMHLTEHRGALHVLRLPADEPVPAWLSDAPGDPLISVTRTAHETSVVVPSVAVPEQLPGPLHGPYSAFEVDGPVDAPLTGVLDGLLRPLTDVGVVGFAVSTFDTDWVLVPCGGTASARAAWAAAGHEVEAA